MPLPTGHIPWPPQAALSVVDAYDKWSAWYAGDTFELARVYGDYTAAAGHNRTARAFFETARPGIRSLVARWFWGATVPVGEQRTKLHIPVPADIAAISADLLYAEPPALTAPDAGDATSERIEDYLEDGLWTSLREAAEVGAALGGVYLRVVWDDQVRERPWLTASSPETVVPEWRWDRLAAATFWQIIPTGDSRDVVRHLERHERGAILHGVYVGTKDDLGRRVALTDFPETAEIAASLDSDDMIETGIRQLTAGYIPNMRPNRIWRGDPALVNIGRSDFSGVEPLFDALDEVWSSWMRDLRLGKARLVVPNSALISLGKGKGATFDVDQELLAGLDLGPSPDKNQITNVQFAIRMEEHRATATELLEQAIRDAGYSMQTLSGTGDVAMTATEVNSRERRSLLTRGRKIQYHGPAIRDMVEALIAIDVARFGPDGVAVTTPHLDWPKNVFVDPLDAASTVQMLRDAQVVSLDTAIRMLHPDWDDTQVQAEIIRIDAEHATAMTGPVTLQPADAFPADTGMDTTDTMPDTTDQ